MRPAGQRLLPRHRRPPDILPQKSPLWGYLPLLCIGGIIISRWQVRQTQGIWLEVAQDLGNPIPQPKHRPGIY